MSGTTDTPVEWVPSDGLQYRWGIFFVLILGITAFSWLLASALIGSPGREPLQLFAEWLGAFVAIDGLVLVPASLAFMGALPLPVGRLGLYPDGLVLDWGLRKVAVSSARVHLSDGCLFVISRRWRWATAVAISRDQEARLRAVIPAVRVSG